MGSNLSLFRDCHDGFAKLRDDADANKVDNGNHRRHHHPASSAPVQDSVLPSPFGDVDRIWNHHDGLEMEPEDSDDDDDEADDDATIESTAAVLSPKTRYALSKPSRGGGTIDSDTSSLEAPTIPRTTIRPAPILSLFQDVTNGGFGGGGGHPTPKTAPTRPASGSGIAGFGTPTRKPSSNTAAAASTPASFGRHPDSPVPLTQSGFGSGESRRSSNPSDEDDDDSFDDDKLVESEEGDDTDDSTDDKEAMKAWFAMFRTLDRLEFHLGKAGAVPVKYRLGEVRKELNATLEVGVLSLPALWRCRAWLDRIEAAFVATPATMSSSPHPKHPLSIQNKELKLLQSLDEILSILQGLTDPVLTSHASPHRRRRTRENRRDNRLPRRRNV